PSKGNRVRNRPRAHHSLGRYYELTCCLSRGCGFWGGPLPDQGKEFLEMWISVMWSRGRLRVVLHGKHRKSFVANTFHSSIVEIDVGDLKFRGTGDALRPTRQGKSM